MNTRKLIKISLTILLTIGLGVWGVSKMPFNTQINQTTKANVYVNGEQKGSTTIEVNGSRSNYLFKDTQKFLGSFCIQNYKRVCREDMNSKIVWYETMDSQIIIYMQNGTFPSLELHSQLYINEEMDEFAFGFEDGKVVATSDKMYQQFIDKIQIHK